MQNTLPIARVSLAISAQVVLIGNICQGSSENKQTHVVIVIISDKYDALIQILRDLYDFEWGKLRSKIPASAQQL